MNKKMEKHLMMKIKMQWAETCETWIKMLLQKVFEIATRRLIIIVWRGYIYPLFYFIPINFMNFIGISEIS